VILRCTKKVLAVLGAVRVADPAPDAEDWYGNLLWFDRRKCLLLTHAGTLFSVFEPDVRGRPAAGRPQPDHRADRAGTAARGCRRAR